jgi:hypothetical protein
MLEKSFESYIPEMCRAGAPFALVEEADTEADAADTEDMG